MKTALLLVALLTVFASAEAPDEIYRDAVRKSTNARFTKLVIEEEIRQLRDADDPEKIARRDSLQADLKRRDEIERTALKTVKLQARLVLERPCPLCGGKLAAISKVKDDRSKPSKNLSVWRSGVIRVCGPPCRPDSPVCTQCWTAQMWETGAWIRESTEVNSFRQPLALAIRAFPLPPAAIRTESAKYYQTLNDDQRDDSIWLKCNTDENYLEVVRKFAAESGLHLTIREHNGQSYVDASTELPAPAVGASFRAQFDEARQNLVKCQEERAKIRGDLAQRLADPALAKEVIKQNERQALETQLVDLDGTERTLREWIARSEHVLQRQDLKRPCPICGGKLVAVRTLKDDRRKPSKNELIWPHLGKDMCQDFDLADTPICKRCWTAQSFSTGDWVRASEVLDSFVVPLVDSIRDFPLPQKRKGEKRFVRYSQFFRVTVREDALFMICKPGEAYLKSAEKFAAKHKLHLRVESGNDDSRWISVSTEPPDETPKAATELPLNPSTPISPPTTVSLPGGG